MSGKEEGDTDSGSGGKDPERQSLESSEELGRGDNNVKQSEGAEEGNKKRRNLFLLALVVLVVVVGLVVGLTVGLQNSSTAQSYASDTWPHEISDIPPDPRVRYGNLPNGLRYMIMSNGELPDRLSIRLHIDAGSLHEDDDQQGLAHFLEHMVFEGTRNFEELPELDRETQRIGAHSNAYTSFDETVYFLDLPVENETVSTGFTILRDFADGALFDEDRIEIERGVVLSEDLSGDSVEWRIFLKQTDFLFPDHRLAQRWPIGKKDVIRTAPRQRFVDFYTQYYVPERITVVAVGDMDIDQLEAYIVDSFESMVQPEEAGQDPDMGTVPKDVGFRAAIFTDEEVISEEAWLTTSRPWQFEPDTEASRTKRLPLDLAHYILGRRFEVLAKEEGSPITDGYAVRENLVNLIDWGHVVVTPLEGRWEDAVRVLEQEVRRAIEYGFTSSELNDIKNKATVGYGAAVATADTRESSDLSWDFIDSINERAVFSTPEVDLDFIEKALDSTTPEIVHQAFKNYWQTEDVALFLTTSDERAQTTADELEKLFMDSKEVKVAPPEEGAVISFQYTDFGPSLGTVVSDTLVADLNIRQLILSNNVRVNMKVTDFDQNYVAITARFGTGRLEQPPLPWFDGFAETVVDLGGLGKHSFDEIDSIFSDNSVWNGFYVNKDDFEFSAEIIADDMEPQLQLMAAYMIDPGYREEAVRSYKRDVPSFMNYLQHSLDGAIEYVDEWLWGNDGRFSLPATEEELLSYQGSDVKDWIHPQMTGGYLELSMVGDFDIDTVLPLVLKTFGALPERNLTAKEIGDEARDINFPNPPSYRTFTYTSKIQRAAAIVAFKIPPIKEDIRLSRRINVLADVFSNRIFETLRKSLGESYSPYAYADASTSFNQGYIWAESEGTPQVKAKNSQLIIDIAQNMSVSMTEDEFIRAKKPLQTDHEESRRDNYYWLYNVMWESQQKPWKLDWSRERDADYDSITLEELRVLAAEYLVPSNAVRIDVLPVAKDAGVQEDEGSARDLRQTVELIKGTLSGHTSRSSGRSFTMKEKTRHDKLRLS